MITPTPAPAAAPIHAPSAAPPPATAPQTAPSAAPRSTKTRPPRPAALLEWRTPRISPAPWLGAPPARRRRGLPAPSRTLRAGQGRAFGHPLTESVTTAVIVDRAGRAA